MKNDPPNKKLTYRLFLLEILRSIDETPCIYIHQCLFALSEENMVVLIGIHDSKAKKNMKLLESEGTKF